MSSLFTPVCTGRLTLLNRLVMAPMTRSFADEAGVPGDLVATYYAQRSGAGGRVGRAVARRLGSCSARPLRRSALAADAAYRGIAARILLDEGAVLSMPIAVGEATFVMPIYGVVGQWPAL